MMKQLLKTLNIQHNIETFVKDEQTSIVGNTLYYKNIPSALFSLKHLEITGKTVPDDGFKVKGTMIDLSRNAVFTVDYFKSVILKQALLGFNVIWLYMEDVYELENYPKFGYLRGRYSLTDLQTLDAYATSLGVELVPCIQTLGHMGQFLRWPSSAEFKDQNDVLLIKESLPLIESMIAFCRKAFQTNQIHIGMDETFGFSLGQHYKKYGYSQPEDLFMTHLKMVNQLCLQAGYKDVLMWSDMFFRHRSKTNYYYDTTIEFDHDFINQIPNNVGLVYWDYYNHQIEIYEKMLQKHIEMNRRVVMASGTWIWTKLAYDYEQTKKTASLAIQACKKLGIREIIFTQWQDDGAYVDFETSFQGLFDVTQWACHDKFDPLYLQSITSMPYEWMKMIGQVNQLGYYPVRLLWDDLLLGIYLNDCVGYDYKKLDDWIKQTKKHITKLRGLNQKHHLLIAQVLKLKLEIRASFLEGYFTSYDFSHTIVMVNRFKTKMDALTQSFTDLWHERYQPFGLEVLQSRLFAQLKRADELLYWIDCYKTKKIDKIPFLEEKLSKEPYLGFKYADFAYSSKQ